MLSFLSFPISLKNIAVILIVILCTACSTSSGNSASGDAAKQNTFNFTAYADETGKKYALYYFNSRKNLSLKPTGGKIVWEDFSLKHKHVATYSFANCRYLLFADGGGATRNPSTRLSFPLLRSNSATQCHYYMEIFDSYYINGYEQQLTIFDNQQSNIHTMHIWLPLRAINNKDIFEVTRVNAAKEGKPYYLITKIVFKKDFILYGYSKDKKILKIYKGSYITFQNRSFFKAYRGVFVQ